MWRFVGTSCTVFVLVVAVGGCGEPNDITPQHPEPIDEMAGSYRGVAVGDKPLRAQQVFGKSCRRNRALVFPCDAEWATAPNGFPGEWGTEAFADVTVFTLHGGQKPPPNFENPRSNRITALLITDPNAQTSEGVGIGDDLDLAKEKYPGSFCDVQTFESSTGNPYCSKDISPKRVLIFGGDPIDSVVTGTPGID